VVALAVTNEGRTLAQELLGLLMKSQVATMTTTASTFYLVVVSTWLQLQSRTLLILSERY